MCAIPQYTGFYHSFLNLGAANARTHFEFVEHLKNCLERGSWQSSLWDVAKAIYNLVKKIFTNPKRYDNFETIKVVCTPKSRLSCPLMRFDFCYLFKTVRFTGIFDGQMIRQALRSNRQYSDSDFCVTANYEAVGGLTNPGRTPFTSKGDDYRELRKYLRPNLKKEVLYARKDLPCQLHELTQETLHKMVNAEDGFVKDVTEATFSLPSKVIQCLLFGRIIPGLHEKMWDMLLLIKKLFRHVGRQSDAEAIKGSADYNFLICLMIQIIQKPREYPGLLSQMAQERNDFGDLMFNHDDLFATLIFMLIAGEDTLSAAMTSTFYELGQHPDVQAVLFELLKPFYKEHEVIDLHTLDNIPYLDHVLKEILRLHPSLPILNRCVHPDKSVSLAFPGESKRCPIQNNRFLLLYLFNANRDSSYWEEAESFNPDRWKVKTKNQLLTFGPGPNSCLGEWLAKIELKALIYYALREFRFETVEQVRWDAVVTLTPSKPVSIRIKSHDAVC